MDEMFLRDHHLLHPQDARLNSVSSTQNELLQKMTSEHLSKSPSGSKYKLKKQVTEQEVQQLRLKINGRERKRMHDLNLAMDGLREVMPYAHGPSVRKLSKIATLLLARNYILMLTSSLDEMKRLVGEIYGGHHSAFHCGTDPALSDEEHPCTPSAPRGQFPALVGPAVPLHYLPGASTPPPAHHLHRTHQAFHRKQGRDEVKCALWTGLCMICLSVCLFVCLFDCFSPYKFTTSSL
ncbi:hypothetical protein PO909_019892 [Leuciscus waleckii]